MPLKNLRLTFERTMEQIGCFEPAPTIGVGVSGGSDSLALAYLMHHWCQERGGKAIALSVNHHLRPEATKEVLWVQEALRHQGMAHEILEWNFSSHPITGLQEKARQARYSLLQKWCEERGVLHLALAHHAQDQAETFLIRLENKSHLLGLSGMSLVSERSSVRLIRPFLSFTKEEICLISEKVYKEWVHDPSNLDLNFRRIYWRKKLESDSMRTQMEEILSFSSLCGKIRQEEQRDLELYWAHHACLHPTGSLEMDLEPFTYARLTTCHYALGRALQTIGNTPYSPRGRQIAHLWKEISSSSSSFKSTNMSRCLISKTHNKIQIFRENRHLPSPLFIDPSHMAHLEKISWDRFHLYLSSSQWNRLSQTKVTLKALGEEGWKQLPSSSREKLKKYGLRKALPSCPSFWEGEKLLFLPQFLLPFFQKETEKKEEDFFSCIFSPLMPLSDLRFIPSD